MKSDLPERTFRFAVEIVKLCRLLNETPGVPKSIVNQLFKAGTSIGANVEEGQVSQSEADFLSKYSISCKEARETHYWLKLLVASEILTEEQLLG
jgi:four helix bundle protein